VHIFKSLFAVILVLALASCSGGSGGATKSLSGSWAGTINDSMAGQGTVTASISQSGNNIVGTWQATFPDLVNGGTLEGYVNGNSVVFSLYPSNSNACPYNVVTNWSGNILSGNYSAFNCTATITGTLTVQK
jgi:hypothetical protein